VLNLLIKVFGLTDELVIGFDDTIERRRGKRIKAKGIYRDAVRSSKSFFVKTSGLRWLSFMLLTEVPFARKVWALPFLTVLCPSERYDKERGIWHRKLTDRARQAILLIKRWLPELDLVFVGDSSFTFEETRRHLGIETNRQWSDKAIGRTTPGLYGMFSVITMVAQELSKGGNLKIRSAIWYDKEVATFSDAIGCVRQSLWEARSFQTSPKEVEMIKIPRPFLECLTDTLCFVT